MKIVEIARSFSKTIQEESFEPLNVFASYKAELEGKETSDQISEISNNLFKLAEEDVRRITDMWTNKREAMRRVREKSQLNNPPFNN